MKKMLPWLITTLLAISLIAIVAVFLFNSMLGDSSAKTAGKQSPAVTKPLSADKRLEVTSQLENIKRNLKDNDKLVVISFAFQLDKKSTKEEFDKIKDIVVKPIINRTLADTSSEGLNGSKGQDDLESKLLTQINGSLPEGKLVRVDITDFILTEM
ncbi:flagellar basal body-associated FliL family protein [Paenibacillus beijingensis]|uniref:Flagellar protein FliL n=1 Tax=Paenibacillus beijingensis TaxID=1126833 RepID=A0A0D5NN28_9BACL|nr:flagellar basal body-associated FliL family protein [Paenibacillus beijingensis]AJY76575.1 flagellar basal body protein FliL [Paenibacillus beijingensis]